MVDLAVGVSWVAASASPISTPSVSARVRGKAPWSSRDRDSVRRGDGHATLQTGIGSEIHLTHAALAERLDDLKHPNTLVAARGKETPPVLKILHNELGEEGTEHRTLDELAHAKGEPTRRPKPAATIQ